MNLKAVKPCINEAPKGVETLTVRSGALTRVQATVVKLDGHDFKSRLNLRVRDRWRALSLALEEVQPGEPLRIERQHADYYFTPRDAAMEYLGVPDEPNVRCRVSTPSHFVFWALKDLLEPLTPSGALAGEANDPHAGTHEAGDIGVGAVQ